MNTVGNYIREHRLNKGLSQEELANRSNINIRTIQRIEKGESEPYGATLRALAEALEIDTTDVNNGHRHKVNPGRALALFRLSTISFLFVPFGNLLLPWVIYAMMGDQIPNSEEEWRRVKRFQLPWTVALSISMTVLVVFMFIGNATVIVAVAVISISLILVNIGYPLLHAYNAYYKQTNTNAALILKPK